MGYTESSWDNLSWDVPQPPAENKYWAELTADEQAAAAILGYTARSWDNESGLEEQPEDKYWGQLQACGAEPCWEIGIYWGRHCLGHHICFCFWVSRLSTNLFYRTDGVFVMY